MISKTVVFIQKYVKLICLVVDGLVLHQKKFSTCLKRKFILFGFSRIQTNFSVRLLINEPKHCRSFLKPRCTYLPTTHASFRLIVKVFFYFYLNVFYDLHRNFNDILCEGRLFYYFDIYSFIIVQFYHRCSFKPQFLFSMLLSTSMTAVCARIISALLDCYDCG